MAFTLILFFAYSIAAVFVIPTTACLLAEYPAAFGNPRIPAIDEVFKITPLYKMEFQLYYYHQSRRKQQEPC